MKSEYQLNRIAAVKEQQSLPVSLEAVEGNRKSCQILFGFRIHAVPLQIHFLLQIP